MNKTRLSVEPQGIEPWSGEGNRQTFYMLSRSLNFREESGSRRPNSTLVAIKFRLDITTLSLLVLFCRHYKSNPLKLGVGVTMAGEL